MRGSVGATCQGSMISFMRRLLHTALGVWFLIVMTMAQGCVGPAQNAGTYGVPDATSGGRISGGSSGQFASANGTQDSTRSGTPANTAGYVADTGASTA